MIITSILLDIIIKIPFKRYGVANYVLILMLFVGTYFISIIVGYVQTRLISSAAFSNEQNSKKRAAIWKIRPEFNQL